MGWVGCQSRDIRMIRPNPRHSTIRPNPRRLYLEGRRPRRLVATGNIKRIATFVPAAGEAAGPPKNPRHSYDSPEPATVVPGGAVVPQRPRHPRMNPSVA